MTILCKNRWKVSKSKSWQFKSGDVGFCLPNALPLLLTWNLFPQDPYTISSLKSAIISPTQHLTLRTLFDVWITVFNRLSSGPVFARHFLSDRTNYSPSLSPCFLFCQMGCWVTPEMLYSFTVNAISHTSEQLRGIFNRILVSHLGTFCLLFFPDLRQNIQSTLRHPYVLGVCIWFWENESKITAALGSF